MASVQHLSWSDLPPELLGLVLKCLPSLADRVRLRAVCHPWRSNARLHSLPPPLPLLTLLDGTFLSIPDGEIIKMHVPDDACCYGSVDNWLFLVNGDGKCSLMDPFSEDTVELPDLATGWHQSMHGCYKFNPVICKLAIPSPLESSLVPLVAIMHDRYNLSILQPPIVADTIKEWAELLEPLLDISFFGGKLYVIDCLRKLISIELIEGPGHKPMISSFKCIIDSGDGLSSRPEPLPSDKAYLVLPYLVEYDGRLLMVRRWICPAPCIDYDRTWAFDVFAADFSTKPCQWRRVEDLGGHALFVSSNCSKSFPAGKCSGVQENCIYFINKFPGLKLVADPLHDSGVYNMKNGVIVPLLSDTAAVPSNHVGPWLPTWLFPTQAM